MTENLTSNERLREIVLTAIGTATELDRVTAILPLSAARDICKALRDPVEPPGRIGPNTPDNDMVICPQCTSQFVAIPVNVQARLRPNPPNGALTVVLEQDNDEGLWFTARTAPEAYLQQELRRLHAAVEGTNREPPHCSSCSCGTAEPPSDSQTKISNLIDALNRKQAKIDALMLEFCPGEIALDDDSPSLPPSVPLPMLSDLYKVYEALRQVGALNWPFDKDHQAILNMIVEKYGRQMGDLLDDDGRPVETSAVCICRQVGCGDGDTFVPDPRCKAHR